MSRTPQTATSIYAIRNKASGEFIKFGAKCAWATVGAAKSAFVLHTRSWQDGYSKLTPFDEQSEYEVVDLLEGVDWEK